MRTRRGGRFGVPLDPVSLRRGDTVRTRPGAARLLETLEQLLDGLHCVSAWIAIGSLMFWDAVCRGYSNRGGVCVPVLGPSRLDCLSCSMLYIASSPFFLVCHMDGGRVCGVGG